MIKNSSKLIFFFSMILGTFISISSNSWLGVWMGLEINLLSFIPLMIDTNNLMSTEASLKYFLTQAFASSILLFSMIFLMMINNSMFQLNTNFLIINMTFLPLMIKSGIAPFHFWFPNVMEGISWYSSLFLMTWQKMAPLLIISYFTMFDMFYLFILTSVIIGAIGGLNQSSLRKILAFSSINHLGWMLSAMLMNEYTWLFYFIIYTIITFSLIITFNSFKIFYINQMFSMFSYSHVLKFILMISFLSLSGLPPFLGFLPKWIIIQSLMTMNQMFLIMTMILMSLITMYFYLRVCYSAFMLNYTEPNWNFAMYFQMNTIITTSITLFISIFGLFLCITYMYSFY